MNGDDQNVPRDADSPKGQWTYAPAPQKKQVPYQSGMAGPIPRLAAPEPVELEWTASEFIAHQKGAGWYGGFALVGALIVAAAFLLTRDLMASFLVAAALGIFAYVASRPPRTLEYRIVPSGIYIGRQFYPYAEYKAFSVVDEGAFSSVMLWPLRRFSMPVGIYYDPKDEERILTVISTHLPLQQHQADILERAMRRIRF